MKSPLRSLITRHPFFDLLSGPHLDLLVNYAMERAFKEGTAIFEQGDTANCFYLINSGNVLLSSRTEDGFPVEIEVLGAGDVLGWSWLFEPRQWQFDARALGKTETIFFYATPLLAQLEDNPALGYDLMRRVAAVAVRRLQKTRGKLIEQLAGTIAH